MITINTNQFSGYDHKAVYAFLMLHNQNEFKIIIPKTVNAKDSEKFSIFWEYHLIAYAGHRLSQMSETFGYYNPSPYKDLPFRFDVEVKDLEKFSDLLYEIIASFDEHDETDAIVGFQIAATEFFNDAFDNKVEATTWGLLSTANDFLSDEPN